MELRLLGPVEVLVERNPVSLGGRQRRTLFTILAVHANTSVSTEKLIDELWGDSPPEAARKTVQAHIAHLRKALNVKTEVLTSANDGYVLRADPSSIDVRRFESLVEEARQARQSDPPAAVEKLDKALALFRGTPLAGLADNAFSLRVEANRIEELRLAAIEDRLDAMISSGDVAIASAEAERLVAEHPLRERLWGLLMLSLYRGTRQAEALQAFSRARQTLAEELGIEPSTELRDLEQRILDHDPTLDRAQTEIRPDLGAAATVVRNPYKGLRAFDEADSGDFFGRDDLIRRLLERLEARRGSNMVVLAGPSGAGKSSAVRAGLIPELRNRNHQVGVMFPGSDPLAALANAIAETTGEAPGDLLNKIRHGDSLNFDGLVIVDQFEELFTMAGDPADIDLFLELITEPGYSLRSLVTVRADFLDRILSHPRIGPILEDALLLVPPLQDHEVAAVVVNPAERVGVGVSPELVQKIVHDIQTRPAALPLLQFALTDTFERRDGDSLTVADYARVGGISGALSRRADELYANLDPEHREAVQQLLLNLVSVTEEDEGVRRRVERDTLLSLTVSHAAMGEVIERLGAQRLLTFDQDPETGKATIEVAHEALIAEWPRLARWVDDARDDLRTRQRLSVLANEWVGSDNDPGYLLTGSQLGQFGGWAASTDLDLGEADQSYIDASLAAGREQEKAAGRRRRLIGSGIAAAVIVATVLGFLTISQRRATDEQARLVRAGDLAADSVANLEIDPELSVLLALEAVETTRRIDGSVLQIAEDALHRALLSDRLLASVGNHENGIAHFSPNGESFITLSEDDAAVARIWNVNPLEPAVDLMHEDGVIDAVFSPDGVRVATTSEDQNLRIFDAASGEVEIVIHVPPAPGEEASVLVPVFSNDGTMVAATNFSGTLSVWDSDTGELIREFPTTPDTIISLNLEFSPDDEYLIASYMTGEVAPGARMWDLETGELVKTFENHLRDVSDVGFTPDGSRLVTSSFDRTLKVWDVERGENVATYSGHQGGVTDLQISADGTVVASSGEVDVRVWNLETLETIAVILGHSGDVDGIDMSRDGNLLLTASRVDLTTRVWDLTDYWSHELLGLPGPKNLPGAVDFHPDGDSLAASRGPGLITVWDSVTGEEIKTLEGPGELLLSLAYSADGTLLAAAGSEGVRLWDAVSYDVVRTFHGEFSWDVSFHPDGGSVLTSGNRGLEQWPLTGGDSITLQPFRTFAAIFSPDGSRIVVSHENEFFSDFFVKFLNPDDGSSVAGLPVGAQVEAEHNRPVHSLSYNTDGSLLITGSEDATAIIWDTASLEPVHRLVGHTGPVFDAAFDPVRSDVATASIDGTVRIWSLETGATRLTLPVAPGQALDLAYSPDGRYLAVASTAGVVTVFILNVEELVVEAQSRLTRWWTSAQCLQYLQTEICPDPPADFEGIVESP